MEKIITYRATTSTKFTDAKHAAEADPGFLERGFIYINVWGFALLILSYFF